MVAVLCAGMCAGSGPARSHPGVGIHAENDTLSLITMCGGVGAGVWKAAQTTSPPPLPPLPLSPASSFPPFVSSPLLCL